MVLTERRNKIFLIGNGFDLAHGLPTRYLDFITWYLKDSCLKAIESGQYQDDCITVKINRQHFRSRSINIEEYINDIILKDEFWKFIFIKKGISVTSNLTRVRRVETNYPILIEPNNEFCSNLLSNCREADWSGIEFEINRIMLKEHAALVDSRTAILIDRKSNKAYESALGRIKELNSAIYQLKSKLIEYLKLNNNPPNSKCQLLLDRVNNGWGRDILGRDTAITDSSNLRNLPSAELQRNVLFLNFNYTTYFANNILDEFESEFHDKYTDLEVIYIHGDLDESIDDIVFGVGDENKEIYSEIESLYDNEWLVPLKSFHYFRNQKYQNLLGFISKGDYDIYVIGHSCSTTDRTLLNMLFENEACKNIHLYHYNGIESYLATAYNIARNFNDKVKLRKVLQPYNANLSTK